MAIDQGGAQPPVAKDPVDAAGEDGDASLTIGELARRTGLTPAVLRTWESRYGFPVPRRLESGHRRYDERDVDLVTSVLHRRDAGVRLEASIADAAGTRPAPTSVYAHLRRRHPHLAPQRLHKSTLLALTRAIEDECCARAQRPVLFAGFQHERFYHQAARRWAELSRTAEATVVFAARDTSTTSTPDPTLVTTVDLPRTAALRREWFLVCDSADHPACLSAWELPGQDAVTDRDRVFEAVWTLEPALVRETALACSDLAATLGSPRVEEVRRLPGPAYASADLRRATSMFNRLVAYLDTERG